MLDKGKFGADCKQKNRCAPHSMRELHAEISATLAEQFRRKAELRGALDAAAGETPAMFMQWLVRARQRGM